MTSNDAKTQCDELAQLRQDHGLLTIAHEHLTRNFAQADQCAAEREGQILELLRQRDALVEALEECRQALYKGGAFHAEHPLRHAYLKADALLQRITQSSTVSEQVKV